MIVLDSTAKSVEVNLSVAKATNELPFLASWEDITTVAFTPGETDGLTSSTAAVKLVDVPAASTQRRIKAFSVYNNDTAAATVNVQYNNAATLRVVKTAVLQIKETLAYANGEWKVFDATGAQKLAQSGTGRWLKTTVLTAGVSFVTQMQTTTIFIRLVGGGGGGGGGDFTTPNMGFGAGGAAGGYAEKTFVVTPNTAYTYAIGGAGTAGTNVGGTGGTGGETTFAVGATTVTAKGGLGGVGQVGASTLAAPLGGAGVIPTNGDINMAGACGENSVRLSGLLGSSGAGANSPFGGGGAARNTNGAGNAATGYGGGGGGGAGVSADQLGGVGTVGCIVVDEYA